MKMFPKVVAMTLFAMLLLAMPVLTAVVGITAPVGMVAFASGTDASGTDPGPVPTPNPNAPTTSTTGGYVSKGLSATVLRSAKVLVDGVVANNFKLPMTSGAKLTLDTSLTSFSSISYIPVVDKSKFKLASSGMLGTTSITLEKGVDYNVEGVSGNLVITFSDSFIDNLPKGESTIFVSLNGKLVSVKVVK